MAIEVLMPKLGLTMEEGTIEEWKFKVGDTVKKGDTLGAIARRNGTSVKALKRANGLKSDLIHINQKLTIPRSK